MRHSKKLFAAVLALAALVLLPAPSRNYRAMLARCGQDLLLPRTVEPRWSIATAGGSCRTVAFGIGLKTNCSPCIDCDRSNASTRRRRERVQGPPVVHHHIASLIDLFSQDPRRVNRGIKSLEALVGNDDARPQIFSDLAAAHLLRFELNHEASELLKAAQYAHRSLDLEPNNLEAQFNLALVYERMFLRKSAMRAWSNYLALDPGTEWAFEASSHLERLAQVSTAGQMRGAIEAAFADFAGDGPSGESIPIVEIQVLRDFAREVAFPSWANSYLSARMPLAIRQGKFLERVGAISAQLGEPFFAVAAAELARGSRRFLKTLALGQGELATGRELLIARDPHACEHFDLAREMFRREGSVFEVEALRYQTRCAYDRFATLELTALATELDQSAAAHGFRSHRGMAKWFLGTQALEAGEVAPAFAQYETALRHFEDVGELGNQAAILRNLANAADYSGDPSSGWRARLKAFELMSKPQDPAQLALTFELAGRAAIDQGYGEIGVAMLTEYIASDLLSDDPTARAEALWWLAEGFWRAGHRGHAVRLLSQAATAATAIRESGSRRRTEVGLAILSSEMAAVEAPQLALAEAQRAFELYREVDGAYLLIDIYLRQGIALKNQGQFLSAIAAFEKGIAEVSRQARISTKISERVRLFERAGKMLELAIQIDLENIGDPQAALTHFEASKAGILLERLGAKALSAEELIDQVPEGTVILEYSWMTDHAVGWSIERGRAQFRELGSSAELAAAIEAWQEGNFDPGFGGRGLYEQLVAPFELDEKLVIVADGPLAGIPFAALQNPETGRFLVEDHEVVVDPSSSVFIALQGREVPASDDPSLLTVGNPSFDAKKYPRLRSLEGALDESRAIAAIWGRATHYEGAAATSDALLSEITRHQVIHFSGHALLSEEQPFYSRLLMTPSTANPSGELWAQSIYELDLRKVRLVVLSACSTGVSGAKIEGALGMGHAFLSAGARQLLTTLWAIDDKETSSLIPEFIRRFKEGRQPAAVLRHLQIEQIASKHPPISWAAFQVQGGNR